MGSTDSMPLVSQTKSAVQYVAGDKKGAEETQKNFLNTCLFISQGKSAYHWYKGDNEAAKETQKNFVQNMSNLADGIPVVGHVKGGIHYVCGDRESGDNSMKAASRTVGVIGGGAVGGLLGGPVGAVAGGIAGGVAVDGATTVIDSHVSGEDRPAGQIAAVQNLAKGDATAGEIFDSCAGIAFDGILGYTAGEAAVKLRNARNRAHLYRVAGETEVEQSVKAGKLVKEPGPKGEVWLSESPDHSAQYSKTRPFKNGVMEVEMPRKACEQMKASAIEQKGSRAMQTARAAEGKGPANVWNSEKLVNNPQGKVNFGIKGKANLQMFNKHIKGIRRIYPESLKSRNSFAQRYSKTGTGAVLRVRDRDKKYAHPKVNRQMLNKHLQAIGRVYPDSWKFRRDCYRRYGRVDTLLHYGEGLRLQRPQLD